MTRATRILVLLVWSLLVVLSLYSSLLPMAVKRLPTPSCKRRSKRTLIRRTALAILDYQSCIWSLRISRRVPYSHAIPITAIAEFTLLTFACLDWCQSTYLTIPLFPNLLAPHMASLYLFPQRPMLVYPLELWGRVVSPPLVVHNMKRVKANGRKRS